MTPAKTATRPESVEELPLGEPLPAELHITPPPAPVVEQAFESVPVSLIRPGPHNPRRDLGDLDGLVASIRAVGILEPLVVERYEGPLNVEPYLLLAGHRRLAAAKLAGLVEVPCIVRATASTPALRLEMALVENLQREGLAPLDEADGYRELVKLGLSQRAIAERVGCSQSHVSKRLTLLELPSHVQKRVEKGTMPLEAAAALTRLKDHPEKLKKAAGEDPSAIVRAVERAEEEIAWEAKVAELRDIAKGKGWKVVDEPVNDWDSRKFKTLAEWRYHGAELDIDPRKHQPEPCHAVMVPTRRTYHSEKPKATSVCTDPARHGPKGASELKAKGATAAPKRQLSTYEIKERPARRADTELTIALSACVHLADAEVARIACELLGLEPLKVHGASAWRNTLRQAAGEGSPKLQRAAFAVGLAEVEMRLRWNHTMFMGDRVAEHFSYLASLGYQTSPFEDAKLAEAAEAEKEDAEELARARELEAEEESGGE
jgi:ParB family chromosome partitioning protein